MMVYYLQVLLSMDTYVIEAAVELRKNLAQFAIHCRRSLVLVDESLIV